MGTFVSSGPCPRPKGAPEFLAFSLKNDRRVRLFNRVSLWRWARTEFNPLAVSLKVNEQTFAAPSGQAAIAIAFETDFTETMVFFDKGISESLKAEIIHYGETMGCCVEFINNQFLTDNKIESTNYLHMLAYIVKWREVFTDRNLERCLRILADSNWVVQDAVKELTLVFQDSAAALFFETVRRGAISLADIKTLKLTGRSRFLIGGAAREQ